MAASQLLSPTSGQTPSISPLPVSGSSDGDTFPLDGSVTVPSKRSRSWDGENEDSGSNKRPRRRSRGDSQDGRDGSSDPPSKGRKSVPDEDLEPSLEKTVSPALDVDEAGVSASGQAQDSGTSLPAPKPKGRQKEKSYVAALLGPSVSFDYYPAALDGIMCLMSQTNVLRRASLVQSFVMRCAKRRTSLLRCGS